MFIFINISTFDLFSKAKWSKIISVSNLIIIKPNSETDSIRALKNFYISPYSSTWTRFWFFFYSNYLFISSLINFIYTSFCYWISSWLISSSTNYFSTLSSEIKHTSKLNYDYFHSNYYLTIKSKLNKSLSLFTYFIFKNIWLSESETFKLPS